MEDEFRDGVVDGQLVAMRRRFADENGAVDHDTEALAFAAAFLAANYLKVGEALRATGLAGYRRIVDLGTGPGAATVAALAQLASQPSPPGQVEVVLVDQSAAQLRVAESVLSQVEEALRAEPSARWPAVASQSVKAAIEQSADQIPPRSDSLVLLSHVVTENPQSRRAIAENALRIAGPGSTVVFVERQDDDCLEQIYGESVPYDFELQYCSGEISWPSPSVSVRHRRLRWLALAVPRTGGPTGSLPATSTSGAAS